MHVEWVFNKSHFPDGTLIRPLESQGDLLFRLMLSLLRVEEFFNVIQKFKHKSNNWLNVILQTKFIIRFKM